MKNNKENKEALQKELRRCTAQQIKLINALKNCEDAVEELGEKELSGIDYFKALGKIEKGIFNDLYIRIEQCKYRLGYNQWVMNGLREKIYA